MTGFKSKREMAQEDDDIQDYKKPWVGLTDEEIERRQEEFEELENMPFSKHDWLWFYTKAIEQVLKKKNT